MFKKMDKENLYYIVPIGTNSRVMNCDKSPRIGEKNAIENVIDKWEDSEEYEAISIADYEKKFIDGE